MAPPNSAPGKPAQSTSRDGTKMTMRPSPPSRRLEIRSTTKSCLKALQLVILAAVYSPVSQLCLSPVYGSIPASLHHPRLVMAAILTGWVTKSSMQKYFPRGIANLLPVFAFSIPTIQFFLFKSSGNLGPVYGPLATELATYFPLAALSVYAAAVVLDALDLSRYGERMQNSGPAIASYFIFTAAEKLSAEYIHRNVGSSVLFTRTGLQFVLAAFYGLLLPSKALLLAVVPLLHFAFLNSHVPLGMTTNALNSTLQLDGFSLIARQESITGYISVLDNVKSGFRVMRCDHSLLGGEFIPPPNYHWKVKDPIYSIFTTLEAVRLVEADFSNTLPAARTTNDHLNALVIGLGIGTAPTALVAHGIHTTTVEIDPVVSKFATQYFSLPKNHTTIIEDAVKYVARAQAGGPSQQTYSYIIHDVFTGGAEPADLFTQEFIQGLSDLLKPEGVIAINYAGDLLLPSAPLILTTILSIFPSCRLFREIPLPPPAPNSPPPTSDFTNLVIFCIKSATPFTFREPVETDFLASAARRENLYPRYEMRVEDLRGQGERVLRRGKTGVLERGQRESAVGHWAIMRRVLPGRVWENW
ncbi:hypothetical protein MMC30_005977 [Trapelia coarctata]|nr:hypothetical protein [Trapelia coarctata]